MEMTSLSNRTVIHNEGIWLICKILDCRYRDCEFNPLSHKLTLLKGNRYCLIPGINAPVSQCYTHGMVKKLVCNNVVGAPVYCTHPNYYAKGCTCTFKNLVLNLCTFVLLFSL